MASKRAAKRQQAARPLSAPAVAPCPALSLRLAAALRIAERDGYGPLGEALNAVIVALSDAKQKASQGRNSFTRHHSMVMALFDEVGAL